MMRSPSRLVASAFAAVLVVLAACGGSVAPIDLSGSSSSSGSSSGSGDDTTSSSSSSGSVADGGTPVKDAGRQKDAAKDAISPNDDRCPATFKAPDGNCDVGVRCAYAEGSCACLGHCGGAPPPPDLDLSHWSCTPKRTDGCPNDPPKLGTTCNGPKSCTYGDCCMQTFICNGKWTGGDMQCPP